MTDTAGAATTLLLVPLLLLLLFVDVVFVARSLPRSLTLLLRNFSFYMFTTSVKCSRHIYYNLLLMFVNETITNVFFSKFTGLVQYMEYGKKFVVLVGTAYLIRINVRSEKLTKKKLSSFYLSSLARPKTCAHAQRILVSFRR